MDMAWADEWSVGNAVIDSDHKELVRLVGDIGHVARSGNNFALSQVHIQFKSCLNRHFTNEEKLAGALGLPFAQHKREHQNIRDEIDFTDHELRKNDAMTAYFREYYPRFLRDWLINHITEEDMLLKPLLQACPYEFKVDEAPVCC